MLSFTLLYRFLNIFGVLQIVYDTKVRKFTVLKSLVPYSIFIILLSEIYIICEGHFNAFEVVETLFERRKSSQSSWFITILLIVDFASYVILNVSIFLAILCQKNAHCDLLNQLLMIDQHPIFWIGSESIQNAVKYRVQVVYYLFLAQHFIAYPAYRYAWYGFTKLAFARLVSVTFHTLQFEFGSLYEMIIMEKLTTNFKVLQKHVMDRHVIRVDDALRDCIGQYEHLWKLAKKGTSLFGGQKILCLTCVNLLASLHFFYGYDRMDNYGWSLMRQMTLNFIFVICNNWHRLMHQVRSLTLST